MKDDELQVQGKPRRMSKREKWKIAIAAIVLLIWLCCSIWLIFGHFFNWLSYESRTFAAQDATQEYMDDSKLSVNQIIEAIKMLTTSEYNEFVSRLASLQRPEDSIDVYIEEQRITCIPTWNQLY